MTMTLTSLGMGSLSASALRIAIIFDKRAWSFAAALAESRALSSGRTLLFDCMKEGKLL